MKEFLLNIDRRIIFVFVALGIIIPSLGCHTPAYPHHGRCESDLRHHRRSGSKKRHHSHLL